MRIEYSAKKKAELVFSYLSSRKERFVLEACTTIRDFSEELSEYLPDNDELFSVYKNVMMRFKHSVVRNSLFNIAQTRYSNQTLPLLLQFLNYEHATSTSNTLRVIAKTVKSAPTSNNELTTNILIDRCLRLVKRRPSSFHDVAAIFREIGLKEEQNLIIKKLLSKIDFNGDPEVNLLAMRLINYLFLYLDFEPAIDSKYFSALLEKDDIYRVLALKGLRYMEDSEEKNALLAYRFHPSSEVQIAANNLMKRPRRILEERILA